MTAAWWIALSPPKKSSAPRPEATSGMNEFMGLWWARCANLVRLQPQRLLYVHVFF